MVGEAERPAEEQEVEPIDWTDRPTVPGLESLGRAIVDAQGQPSGSPANYEVTRGATDTQVLPPAADVVASIAKEFEGFGAPAPEAPPAPEGGNP